MAAKNIVILSDGTGNSAAALSKTNVWRLYRALDLSRTPAENEPIQVAIYRDGVGTSSFKLLALLGGIFGVGLSRNVVELYKFLCATYEPGDRIYAFGFSRGAFTVRILVAMVLNQGLVTAATAEDLDRYAPDAYRDYRRRYKLPIFGAKSSYADDLDKHQYKTIGLVDVLRNARDMFIGLSRRLTGGTAYDKALNRMVDEIAFVGVWDSVAAYGLPLDELTRGIDTWVWPLSMPNYDLSPKVACARHALALDEERDSFSPLLWDEAKEPLPGLRADRLKQVWFAGVHSNLGGGYPDDTLSYVPLTWMIEEARAEGLRFNSAPLCEAYPPPNPLGRMYDSRAGLGSYYRYQPRRLGALLLKPKNETLIQRDPARNERGFLREALVHDSVLQRIAASAIHYAPTSLTEGFWLATTIGSPPVPSPGLRVVPASSTLWTSLRNDIWRRRVTYFATVLLSLGLVLLPVVHRFYPPTLCEGPQCLISPLVETVGGVLPGLASPWIKAFAAAPGTFLFLAIVIVVLMARSSTLKQRIHDDSRALWVRLPTQPKSGPALPVFDRWIAAVRTNPIYLGVFQVLKWRLLPWLFGLSLLSIIVAVGMVAGMLTIGRTKLALAERSDAICRVGDQTNVRDELGRALFPTRKLCWETGADVAKGRRYRLILTVVEPWRDKRIAASPLGFESDRLPLWARLGVVLRRSLAARWFQPVLRVKPPGEAAHLMPLHVTCASDCAGKRPAYLAEFAAAATGRVSLFVNDVVLGWTGLTAERYDNNSGSALVTVEEIEPLDAPPDTR